MNLGKHSGFALQRQRFLSASLQNICQTGHPPKRKGTLIHTPLRLCASKRAREGAGASSLEVLRPAGLKSQALSQGIAKRADGFNVTPRSLEPPFPVIVSSTVYVREWLNLGIAPVFRVWDVGVQALGLGASRTPLNPIAPVGWMGAVGVQHLAADCSSASKVSKPPAIGLVCQVED